MKSAADVMDASRPSRGARSPCVAPASSRWVGSAYNAACRHVPRVLLVAALLIAAGLLAHTALAQAPPTQPAETPAAEPMDPVCDVLFREYACGGKINTVDREAAIVLVASRGRNNGYWRVVLQALRDTGEERSSNEVAAVRILGKMLTVDGHGREILEEQERTGKPYGGQWAGPYVVLDDSVVDELLTRAKELKRRRDHRAEYYVEALAAAREPRTREYLLDVVRTGRAAHPGDRDCFSDECCLTAAIGLAKLREPAGVEWLIENCESTTRLNWRHVTSLPKLSQLGSGCCRALDELDDESQPELTTRAQWQAWWNRAKAELQAR